MNQKGCFRSKQSQAISSAYRHNEWSAATNIWLGVECPVSLGTASGDSVFCSVEDFCASLCVFLGLSGPLCASLCFSQALWASLGLSGPLWASLGFSGPLWASLGFSNKNKTTHTNIHTYNIHIYTYKHIGKPLFLKGPNSRKKAYKKPLVASSQKVAGCKSNSHIGKPLFC